MTCTVVGWLPIFKAPAELGVQYVPKPELGNEGGIATTRYQESVRNGEAGSPSLLYKLAPSGFME